MNFPSVTFSNVVDLNPRASEVKHLADDVPVSFIPMAAVDEVHGIITDYRIRPISEVRKGFTYFKEGDVLLAKITPCMENGKIAIATKLEGGIGFGSTEFHVFRTKPNILNKYLYFYLRQPQFRATAKSAMRGAAGQQRVPSDFLEKHQIPLPHLREQNRIVEILDQADTLRRQRAAANTQATRLLPTLFQHYFGNLQSNTKMWPTATIDDLCDLVRGSSPRPQGDPRYFGGPVPRLMIQDITRDGWHVTPMIDSLTLEGAKLSRPVPAGTIVMAVSGAVGLCAQLAIDACIHDGFVAFKNLDNSQVNTVYFGQILKLLRSFHVSRQAGAVFQNITTTDVKETRIPIPPRSIQNRFAQDVANIDNILLNQGGSTTQLETLFQVLLQRAFDGRLTAQWREAHAAELLQEMELQARS